MQKYNEIKETDTLCDSLGIINDNFDTVRSCYSGDTFPTVNLTIGMLCYRTDEEKLYVLDQIEPAIWNTVVDTDVINNAISKVNESIEETNKTIEYHKDDPQAHASIINEIRTIVANSGLNLLRRNTQYAVGDIAYSSRLPSWARLECVQAGTTDTDEPDFTQVSAGGVLTLDGAVKWIIDDVRDLLPVGSVVGRMYLSPGYVKANGATVLRADYPRLVALADKRGLWTADTVTHPAWFGVGDGSTTFTLPDWRGVVERFQDEGKGYDSNRAIGTYQPDVIASHNHGASAWTDSQGNHRHSMTFRGYSGSHTASQDSHISSGYISGSYTYYTNTTGAHSHNVGISIANSGAAENRVKNIAVCALIKY